MSDTTYNSANGPTGGGFDPEYNAGNSGAALTIDWSNSTNQKFTLTASTTLTLSNPQDGATYHLRPIVNGTGYFTITWPANVYWFNSVAPIASTSPNAVDYVTLYYDGTNYWGSYTYDYQYQMQTTRYKSLSLDGVNEWVNFGNLSLLNFERSDAFSISAWIKFPSSSPVGGAVLSKMTGASVYKGWTFYISNSNYKPSFYMENNNTDYWQTQAATAINDNTWHHIAHTYGGSTTAAGSTFYIDGAPSATTTVNNTLSGSITNSNNVGLGGENGASFFIKATLKDVCVFNTQITAGAVASIYNFGLSKSWPGDVRTNDRVKSNLIFWARCGDDPLDSAVSGTGVIVDQIKGNNGTPTNTESGDIVTDAPNL